MSPRPPRWLQPLLVLMAILLMAILPPARLEAAGEARDTTAASRRSTEGRNGPPAGGGPSYDVEVGPGRHYESLAAVPWGRLKPGQSVAIHYREEPYREKLLLSASGTPDKPIRIVGVRGPAGERPVLDGEDATTPPGDAYVYAPTQGRGLMIVSPRKGDYRYGQKPSHLVIEGLELRNAASEFSFTDASGARGAYTHNAAGLFVERGVHITVRDCSIHGCGNGLFVASGGDEALVSRDILIQECEIRGNGNVGRDREHNAYTEAVGVTFEGNWFGRPRAGSLGSNLKDRSAGCVIRYNRFEGGANMLDLVDPEESWRATTADPSYAATRVYGNLFVNRPGDGGFIVHFGGDTGFTERYRPRLRFDHNTVDVRASQTGDAKRWRTILFRLDGEGPRVEANNNVLRCSAADEGGSPTEWTLMDKAGRCVLGTNWISPGWLPSRSGVPFTGSIAGQTNLLSDPNNDPGLTAEWRLKSGSPCIDAGTPAEDLPAVERQYVHPAQTEGRPRSGAPDLGAYEYDGRS